MMFMVDKYLTTEVFKFNALSRLNIALFIYYCQKALWYIYARATTFSNKTTNSSQRLGNPKAETKAKKFGLKAKTKD